MKKSIKLFHTTHPSEFAFSSLSTLKEVYDRDTITAQDIAENYAHVAQFEMSEAEMTEELGSFDDNFAVAENVFHMINHPGSSKVAELIDQDHIREQKSHTSTSVGDIVQIDDEFFYCDDFGFAKIELGKEIQA